jgi:hypothetical protein
MSLGAADEIADAVGWVWSVLARVARPLLRAAAHSAIPAPPHQLHEELNALGERGHRVRLDAADSIRAAAEAFVEPAVQQQVGRIDTVAIARRVVDEIDLPRLVRESSSAAASESVRGVRVRGIEADEAVSRVVDRLLLRHRGRDTAVSSQAGPE